MSYKEKCIPERLKLDGFRCNITRTTYYEDVVYVGDYYHEPSNELYNIYMTEPGGHTEPKVIYLPDENYGNLWKMITEDGYIPHPGKL